MVWILTKALFFGFGIGFAVFFAIFMVIVITDDPEKAMRLRRQGYDAAVYEITHMGQFYDRKEGKTVKVKVTRREADNVDADTV